MGLTNYPHGVTSFGVPVFGSRQSDIVTGNVFFVDSGHNAAIDAVNGGQRDVPFATLDFAVGQCTANNGDTIFVLPGHAENLALADAVDVDVAGVSIIGVGKGSDRPTFTYTVAAGEFVIGADNVLIENMVFNAGAALILIAIDIEDSVDYATIRNCEFGVGTEATDEFITGIALTNNNTGCIIEGCYWDMDLQDGCVQAILLDADTERTTIRHNIIMGDYSTACIFSDTALSEKLIIQGNMMLNGESDALNTEPCVELITNTTGIIADNYLITNVDTEELSCIGDKMAHFNNLFTDTVDTGVGIVDTPSAWT